jgi:DedD protein
VERHVKERLVGAAVLMAAAIILIPEMLSGPPRGELAEPARGGGETPLKTYTIDLTQPRSRLEGTEQMPDTRAPPPEMAAQVDDRDAAALDQAEPESVVSSNSPATPQPAAEATPALPVVPEPQESAAHAPVAPLPASPSPARQALVTTPNAPITAAQDRGWAVQLGSFSSRSTADRLVTELREEGHSAFVMPVKSGAVTLYRVRIGPLTKREAANETLRKIKPKVSGAAVVSHP